MPGTQKALGSLGATNQSSNIHSLGISTQKGLLKILRVEFRARREQERVDKHLLNR